MCSFAVNHGSGIARSVVEMAYIWPVSWTKAVEMMETSMLVPFLVRRRVM
jgi:hypothetical protein